MFPTVVKHNAQYKELRCPKPTCQRNIDVHTNGFFNGVEGFIAHYEKDHQTQTSKLYVLDNCSFRIVSEHDAALLREVQCPDDITRVLGPYYNNLEQPILRIAGPSDTQPITVVIPKGASLNNCFKNIMWVDNAWKELWCNVEKCGTNYTASKTFL